MVFAALSTTEQTMISRFQMAPSKRLPSNSVTRGKHCQSVRMNSTIQMTFILAILTSSFDRAPLAAVRLSCLLLSLRATTSLLSSPFITDVHTITAPVLGYRCQWLEFAVLSKITRVPVQKLELQSTGNRRSMSSVNQAAQAICDISSVDTTAPHASHSLPLLFCFHTILAQKAAIAQTDFSSTGTIFHALLLTSALVLTLENFTSPAPVELKAVRIVLAQTAHGPVLLTRLDALTKPVQLEWNGPSVFLAVKEPAPIFIFSTSMPATLLNAALAANVRRTSSDLATSVSLPATVHVSEVAKATAKMK